MSSYQDFEINTDFLEEIKLPNDNTNIIDSEFDENLEDLQKLELNLNINEDSDNISQDSLNQIDEEVININQEQNEIIMSENPHKITQIEDLEEVEEYNLNPEQDTLNFMEDIDSPYINMEGGGKKEDNIDEVINEDENDQQDNFLDLTRGFLLKLKKDNSKEYIVVQTKEVVFDNETNSFLRKYRIRQLNNEKLSHDLVEIFSNEIESIISVDKIRQDHPDIEYEYEEDNELDIEQQKSDMEDIDPTIGSNSELVSDMDLDIEEEEIIKNNINEEGFEFEEIADEDIIISIEKELDESQILFTENEQEEDILDELIRMLPEKNKGDRNSIKKISKIIQIFKFLKNKHSESGLDKNKDLDESLIEILKQNIALKTPNFKPLLHNYINNNYSCNYIIPLLNSEIKQYEKKSEEGNQTRNHEYLSDQIERLDKIQSKYKKNKDLDYQELNNELENFVRDKKINKNFERNFLKRMDNDTFSINNLDTKNKEILDTRNILGQDNRLNELYELESANKGERVNIIGYLKLPDSIFNKQHDELSLLLERTEIRNYKPIDVQELYNISYDEGDIKIYNTNGSDRFKKDEKVKVCIPKDNTKKDKFIEIVGKVIDSRRGFIYVEPDDDKIIDKVNNILEFDTNSDLLKISKEEDIKSIKNKCEHENDKIIIYRFDDCQIDDLKNENILDEIIPSIKRILHIHKKNISKIVNYNQLNDIVRPYLLSYNDFEIKNANYINNILDKNEKILRDNNMARMAKFDRDKTNYFKDLKKEQDERTKKDFKIISNEEIENSKGMYTDYIYNKFSFDSEEERLIWLNHQEDMGKLIIYDKVLGNIQEENKKIKVADLEGKLQDIKEENERIGIRLEEEKRKSSYFKPEKPNKCREMKTKVVKIYLNKSQLEADNIKSITVGDHYIIGDINNQINKVKEGDYCILKHEDNPSLNPDKIDVNDKIYKRIKVGEGKEEMWILQSKLKIIDFLRESKDFCNRLIHKENQKGEQFCKLDEKEGICLPERIAKLKKAYEENEKIIEQLEKRIKSVRNVRKEERMNIMTKIMRNRGRLNIINKNEQQKFKIKQVEELEKVPIEIDISDIKDYDYISKLEKDLSDPIKKQELLIELRDKYGIDFIEKEVFEEDERELFTQGDFNEKGQRIEITEVLPGADEKEKPEQTNSDILDAIKMYLNDSIQEENDKKDNENLITVRNIISTLKKIMGLNTSTEICENKCIIMIDEQLRTKSEYINEKYLKKGKPTPKKTKIDKQYNAYKLQNIIFITTANLLVHLQLNVSNYFTLPYEKCVSTIYGFPLTDESNMDSVNYLSCVLSNLSKSGKYWESIEDLNRGKISKRLVAYLGLIVENSNIQNKLSLKLLDIEVKNKIAEEVENEYYWQEFRPPLQSMSKVWKQPPNVDLADTDLKNSKSLMSAMSLFNERKLWISLKIIDSINNIIESQNIENIKYDPLPIANSCCLSKVNKDYDYITFLKEKNINGELNDYIDESINMDRVAKKFNRYNIKLLNIKPSEKRNKLKSFVDNILPNSKQLNNNKELIINYFVNFVDTNNINRGVRRYFKDNICNTTGKHIKEITSQSYTVDDFEGLFTAIQKKNKLNIRLNNNEEEDELQSDLLNAKLKLCIDRLKIILNNKLLKENEFIKDLLEEGLDKINSDKPKNYLAIYDRLDLEIIKEKEDLLYELGKVIDKKKLDIIKNTLDELHNFKNLESEDIKNIEILGIKENIEKKLKENKFKRSNKSIKGYITNYFIKYINILTNKDNKIIQIKEQEIQDMDRDLEDSQKQCIKFLNQIHSEEYKFLDKYRKSKIRQLFRKISKYYKNINNIKNIKGYEDILDCNNLKIHKSRFDYENSAKLIEFIFILLLNKMIEKCEDDSDVKSSKSKRKDSVISDDDDDEDMEFEIGTSNMTLVCHFISDLLFKIKEDKKFIDSKLAQSIADKDIKTKNEENKDRNLYVMEILDEETKKLRKELTTAGITQYANLSRDFNDTLIKEENDNTLREEYRKLHGSTFNEDSFQNYKENMERERRIENEIRLDNEIYLDAEGDDELEI